MIMEDLHDSQAFRYQPLLENQFRIQEIDAIEPEVRARLVTNVAGQAPSFDALSYAWGREPQTVAIGCNNARFVVSPHLHACLVSIFKINGPTRLWVDAICIDQKSDSEKGAQVARMHRLYHSANLVYVWLGRAEHGSDELMDAINQVSLPPDVNGSSADDLAKRIMRLKAGAPKLFPEHLFGPMVALGRRAWFKRLWIVQEYLMAQSVIFLCGDKKVDGKKLSQTLQKMSIYSFEGTITLGQDTDIFTGFEALRALDGIKKSFHESSALTFFDFVMLGRSRLAKEPVDRIYAMLGLARESDTVYTTKLSADYSEASKSKYWETFVAFGKIALQSEAHLRLLCVASSVERPDELPSWCPNVCSPAELGQLDDISVYAAGWPHKSHVDNVGLENCVGHPHFIQADVSHVAVRNDSNVISIWGARLDIINKIGDLKEWTCWEEPNSLETIRNLAKGLLKWLTACDKFCQTFGKYDKSPAMGRTSWNAILVHQSAMRTRPNYEQASSTPAAKLESIKSPSPEADDVITDTVYILLIETLIELLELKLDEEETEKAARHLKNFEVLWVWLLILDQSWNGRILFATKDGYLGCAPEDVIAGDIVCTLYGGRTMYVLRKHKDGYQFVGEAFVYDRMGGEIFEMLDEGTAQEEEFSLY